jgi:hypothetical protein
MPAGVFAGVLRVLAVIGDEKKIFAVRVATET